VVAWWSAAFEDPTYDEKTKKENKQERNCPVFETGLKRKEQDSPEENGVIIDLAQRVIMVKIVLFQIGITDSSL
jgi:hypothetical protein